MARLRERRGDGPAARMSELEPVYNHLYTISMEHTYSVATARAKLAEIIDRVEAGQVVELVRRGKRVAVVVSTARYARLAGEQNAFGNAYDSFVKEHDMGEYGVEDDWATDLRDRSPGRAVKL